VFDGGNRNKKFDLVCLMGKGTSSKGARKWVGNVVCRRKGGGRLGRVAS